MKLLKSLKNISCWGLGILVFIGIIFPLSGKSYAMDKSHSAVKFKVVHLLISDVEGRFTDFNFKLDIDNQSIKRLEGEVSVNSVNTDNRRRDNHLKDPDFFEVKKYPKMTFTSTGYKKINKNSGVLSGWLTIKKEKRKIDFQVTISDETEFRGKKVVGIKLQSQIKRKDFGVGDDFANGIISDAVDLTITMEASR